MIGKIEEYEILDEIFVGKDTFVLKCKAEEMYAMKLLVLDKTTSQQMVERFKREMSIISTINHPNIIRGGHGCGLGTWRNKNCFYYIMEYVNGPSLSDLLQNGNRFSIQDTLSIAMETLNGLLFLKKKNIVHRDIKPSNILISDLYEVKIADLGLAKIIQQIGDNHQITMGPTILGTPYYLAPERIFHNDIDYSGDIYSLGATLYEMFAGFPPYRNLLNEKPSLSEYIDILEMCEGGATRLKDINSNISNEISNLVTNMLLRDKSKRPSHEKIIESITKMVGGYSKKQAYPTSELAKVMATVIKGSSHIEFKPQQESLQQQDNSPKEKSIPLSPPTQEENIATIKNIAFFRDTFVVVQKIRYLFEFFKIKVKLNPNEKTLFFKIFRDYIFAQRDTDILNFVVIFCKIFGSNAPVLSILNQAIKVTSQDLEQMAKSLIHNVKFTGKQNEIQKIAHFHQKKKYLYLNILNDIIEHGICSKPNIRITIFRFLEEELK